MTDTFERIVANLEAQERRFLPGGWRRAVIGAVVATAAVGAFSELVGLLLPGTSPFSVHAAHVDAVLRPFAIAAAAGFAGGVLSGPESIWDSDWWETRAWRDRWRGAAVGGGTTLLVAVGLAVVGL